MTGIPHWHGPIPASPTLFRAWAAPRVVAADFRGSQMVLHAVTVLDAYHHHRAGLRQLLALPPGYDDLTDLAVITDSLHQADRDLRAAIARIDLLLPTLTPARPARDPAVGFGGQLFELARRWSAVTTAAGASRTYILGQLSGQALTYDLLAADLAAGRGRPARPADHDDTAATRASPHDPAGRRTDTTRPVRGRCMPIRSETGDDR